MLRKGAGQDFEDSAALFFDNEQWGLCLTWPLFYFNMTTKIHSPRGQKGGDGNHDDRGGRIVLIKNSNWDLTR